MKFDLDLNLNDESKYSLTVITVIFFLITTLYISYSAYIEKSISSDNTIHNNIVMKVLEHNVKSVCPKCGFKGSPVCPTCSVPLYWNGYKGTFICTSCGKGGFPKCKNCSTYMTWIESR